MGASVHQLRSDEPASRYSPEERARILATARANSTAWEREQRNAPHPLELPPIEDGLAKWRREAAEAEASRRAAEERREREIRREQRQAQRAASQSWADWIGGEIERRLAERLEEGAVTRDLLKLHDAHNESFELIAKKFETVKAENVELRAMLAEVRSDFAQKMLMMTQRIASLEQATTKSAVTVESAFRRIGDELTTIKSSPAMRVKW